MLDSPFLAEAGALVRLAGRFFREGFRPRYEVREFLHQCYVVGYQSLPMVDLTGFIMGLVLTLQSRPTMAQFGAESWIPTMAGLTIIREMGPIITALIFAGKIGSRIGAELGSMRVTEQIDAMEVSGTNPFKCLVVTRVLATTLMLPVLTVLADGIGLFASYVGLNTAGTTSLALFVNNILGRLTFGDVLPAFIKTFFFGFAVGPIGYPLTDKTLAGQLRHAATRLAGTSDTLAATVAGLQRRMATGGGPVQALLTDTAMSGHLRQSMRSVAQGTHKLDQSMKALQHNFLLRGYFWRQAKMKAPTQENQADGRAALP